MRAARRRVVALAAILGSSTGAPLLAQTTATLGMGVSLVEYEGFLASGAGTITPALRHDARDFSFGIQGGWTVFESGNQILQATTAASWLATLQPRLRIELSGAAGASRYADEPGSAHALGSGRLHLLASSSGGWAGATTGAVSSATAAAPFELEAGAWTVRQPITLVGTVSATWLDGDRHVDLLGAARWTAGRVELETRVSARPWTRSDEDIGDAVRGVFGEVSALVSLSERVALALGAGTYPADPVRRALAARYATAAIRFSMAPPRSASPPRVSATVLAALQNTFEPPSSGAPSIEIVGAGQPRALRVHAPGARSVELMADFTDWQPLPLTRTADGSWQVEIAVTPGTHRLNIRVDGGEWIVPAGARSEAGEFGGNVGVITVR